MEEIAIIIIESDKWSGLPALMQTYFGLIDAADGIMRVFGYASLIDRHAALKLPASRALPNERARLPGMEVNMNLLTDKLFAGLEPSQGGNADGVNITIVKEDREAAFEAFIKRELGMPPWGAGIKDIYDGRNKAFIAIKDSSADLLTKYKLCIVNVRIATFGGIKEVPALAVITNPELATSLIGKPASYIARLLQQDSQSLRYFWKDAVAPARACGMRQKRLEFLEELLNAAIVQAK